MCEFNRQVQGSAFDAIERARGPIQAAGGALLGDDNQGTIRVPTPVGEIVGDYRVIGNTITFRITSKPFFVPCTAIESRVDKFLFG